MMTFTLCESYYASVYFCLVLRFNDFTVECLRCFQEFLFTYDVYLAFYCVSKSDRLFSYHNKILLILYNSFYIKVNEYKIN